MSCWPPSAHNEKPSEYGVNGNDFSNGISPNEMFISSIYTAEKCWWSVFISKVLFHMIYLFLSFERVFPLRMWKDSLIPVSVVNYAHMRYPKTLSQKVITYHWDQATIGNGSLFSHKNTQHTALATVTLDCIVLQSIFLAGGICAQKQIYKIPKVGFPKLPKRISINFYDRF